MQICMRIDYIHVIVFLYDVCYSKMFRFKIESTAKRRSLLALAQISQLSPAHGLQHGICSPQQLVLHPVSNLTRGWEQRFATLQNFKARWFLSNSININISQKDASTFKIKDFSSKISEMNEITWTNIYTIHLCKYGQTPFIPPPGVPCESPERQRWLPPDAGFAPWG